MTEQRCSLRKGLRRLRWNRQPGWHRALRSLLVVVMIGLVVVPARAADPPLMFHQIVGVDLFPDFPAQFVSQAAGDLFYFTSTDSTHGTELWVTDGTQAGTHLVKDLNPGTTSTNIVFLGVAGQRVYFSWVQVVNPNKDRLMVAITDGSKDGTVDLGDLGATSTTEVDTTQHLVAGGKLYLVVHKINTSPTASFLWGSAGTPASTFQLASVTGEQRFTNLIGGSSRAFFEIWQPSSPVIDLWRTDGTPGGTRSLVSTFCINPSGLAALDDSVYFSAIKDCEFSDTDSGVQELWSANGVSGTLKNLYTFPHVVITTIVPTERVYGFTSVNGNILFFFESASPEPDMHGIFNGSIWKVNGATQEISKISAGYDWRGVTSPRGMTMPVAAGKLLFYNVYPLNDDSGISLDCTDGTPAGTFRLFTAAAPTLPGNDIWPPTIVQVNNSGKGSILFLSNGPNDTQVLYHSDGTPGGTITLKTLSSAGQENPLYGWFGGADFGGSYYFIYYYSDSDTELFMRTDGTVAGTREVDFAAGKGLPYYILGATPQALFLERLPTPAPDEKAIVELWALSNQLHKLYLPLVQR